MLQLKNKKKIYFYIFSLLFLSSILNNNFRYKFSENFLITNIEIDVNTLKLKDKIFNKIEFLLDKNIFRVNKNDILNKFEELNYLENIQIKKNYPSTLRIKARQTRQRKAGVASFKRARTLRTSPASRIIRRTNIQRAGQAKKRRTISGLKKR